MNRSLRGKGCVRRLLLCALLGSAAAPVCADQYGYDELGNVQTLTSPRGTRTYTHDEIQRLDTETGYTGNRDHAYDLNGNRATDGAASPGTPTSATYTANTNRIATIDGAAVTIDAAGQITNDGLNTYTWDDAGRLKTVSRSGTLRATYHYDHKHRRTRKVSTAAAPQGAKTLVYHYDDQDRLIAETTETGAPVRSYLWADATLLAQVEYTLNATTGLYTVSRELLFELDHLGTPRQARLTGGSTVWRWESDGYGNTLPNEDPDGNGQKTYVYLRFPGQYYDEESGLHYNWHRYYSPKLGRYLSSDPIGIKDEVNTYSYAASHPIRMIDPTGLANGPAVGPILRGQNAVSTGAMQISFGAGGMGVLGPLMTSADSGLAIDSKGTICFFTNTCVGGGWNHPLNATLGLTAQAAKGALCSGEQITSGPYWYGGAGIGGEGQIHTGSDGVQYERGIVGINFSPDGSAGGVGYSECRTRYYCVGR